jgi:hypothetical protein
MDLEEHTLDEPFAARCEVCGVELTAAEIEAAREAGGPFLCTVHAAEELPAAEGEEAAEP